jgi:trafficking protein particle complex subunit 8
LRTDFQNDKAWRHYAGAAEMAALSALIAPTPLSSKSRAENIDAWIEAASYSYTDRQRSAAPYYALRTLALSFELLRLRGASMADDAARWATRILETGLVGAIGHALITERISACYAVRTGLGTYKLGSRQRKAAFWSVLAADHWWRLEKSVQAEKSLDTALRLYNYQVERPSGRGVSNSILPLEDMQRFVDELRQRIVSLRLSNQGYAASAQDGEQSRMQSPEVEEATETLDASPRLHRKSLIGVAAPPIDLGDKTKDSLDTKSDEGFE